MIPGSTFSVREARAPKILTSCDGGPGGRAPGGPFLSVRLRNQTVSMALVNRSAADREESFPVAACPLAAGISGVLFPRQSCGLVEFPVLT